MRLCALLLLLVSSAFAQPPLPDSFYADMVGTRQTITMPPGDWRISRGKEINVRRSNLKIIASGATLITDDDVALPLGIGKRTVGGLVYFGNQDGRRRARGKITPATNTLLVDDVPGLAVGHVVLIRCGVNPGDPNEPVRIAFRKVTKIAGNVVKFAPEFGFAIPTYADEAALKAVVHESQHVKIGPWGVMPSGRIGRGLGEDHDLYCFEDGQPLRNVTLEGLRIAPRPGAKTYGAAQFSVGGSINVLLLDCEDHNPAGSCVHFTNCENSHSLGFKVTGTGRTRWFADSAIAPAIVWSQWSGNNCSMRYAWIDAENVQLTNFESALHGIKVQKVHLRSGEQTYPVPHLGWGDYEDVSLDVPMGTPIVHTGGTITNLTLVRDEVPSWLPVSKLAGTVRIGRRNFGPLEKIDLALTTDSHYFPVPRPPGLYKSASIVLESRDGIRAITAPNDVLGPGDSLTLPLTSSIWSNVRPGTIEQYYAMLECVVWAKAGVRFRFQAEYFPEN